MVRQELRHFSMPPFDPRRDARYELVSPPTLRSARPLSLPLPQRLGAPVTSGVTPGVLTTMLIEPRALVEEEDQWWSAGKNMHSLVGNAAEALRT
ncbi:unnamed protein product [Trichogramma brassicae]|uniref:Uncharacterized protein n=1 Tax=Trichogramma brassicae TaxID=86971 RepID=A0A6H5I9Y3_9HYME|nr:unnamed protein product [Trichogramma brassicae]